MAAKKKVREEIIFAGLCVLLVLYSVVAEWWKKNQILGWVIVGVVVIGLVFLLMRFGRFRQVVTSKIKDTTNKIVFDEKVSEREPIPSELRQEIYTRAQNRCENETCGYKSTLHIHHIDMNNSNNKLTNLLALCPNCHCKAHDGIFTATQLHNWMSRDYHRLLDRRRRAY
jgi:5-methylcytosine-specific restriction endonuclease McrA